MRNPLQAAAGVALAGAVLLASCAAIRPPVEVPESDGVGAEGLLGRPVPPFTAWTLEGRAVSPAQERGKLLLVQLWGVNCSSCLVEMRFLEELYREYQGRGLVIWGVNAEQLGPEQIRKGLERKQVSVSYPVLSDPDLKVTATFTELFIPVLAMVDTRGVVQYYKVGFNPADRDKVRKRVEELLP